MYLTGCSGDDATTFYASCCSSKHKCPFNHGDCDRHSDCLPGLRCGDNNCPLKPGFDSSLDCCEGIVSIRIDKICYTLLSSAVKFMERFWKGASALSHCKIFARRQKKLKLFHKYMSAICFQIIFKFKKMICREINN